MGPWLRSLSPSSLYPDCKILEDSKDHDTPYIQSLHIKFIIFKLLNDLFILNEGGLAGLNFLPVVT